MNEFLKNAVFDGGKNLEHFNELLKSTESQSELVHSLKYLIKKSPCCSNDNYECYCNVFEAICKQIKINELEDNQKFVDLFDRISNNEANQFKIYSLICLLKVLTLTNEIDKLSTDQTKIVMSSLKVDLASGLEIRNLIESYEKAVNSFIQLFHEKFIRANSKAIRSFLEFCLLNSRESEKCPYNSIGLQLIDLRRRFKPPENDSIFHGILGQKDEIYRLIELYFKSVTDENDINEKLLNQFSYQVLWLVNVESPSREDYNGNIECIFSCLLAAFNKTKIVRKLKIVLDFYFRIRDSFKKSKKIFTNEFIGFLLKQLKVNLDEFVEKNRTKSANLDQVLDILGRLLEDLFYIVLTHVKDTSFVDEWISIMIRLTNINRISYHRLIASSIREILNNKYMSFRKHPNECAIIIEKVFELVYIYYVNDDTDDNNEKEDSISNLLYALKSKIEKHNKMKIIQDQLYENIIFRMAEKPLKSQKMYEIAESWFDLIDPCEVKDEKRLKDALKLATIQLNIESSHASYYLNFVEFISNCIQVKKGLDRILEEELVGLIEFANKTDEFINDDDRPNMNLLIIMKISSAFSHNHELTDTLVEKLVDSWFNVYSKHHTNDMIHSLFTAYCVTISCHRPQSIASKADLLWQYLFETNETSFINILSNCLKMSLDCFRNRFSNDYFDFIVNNKSKDFHTTNLFLLYEINNVIPEFYLELSRDKSLRIIKLFELAKEIGIDILVSQLMGVVVNIASVLRKQAEVFDKYNRVVFEQRKRFHVLIDFGKKEPRFRAAFFYALADLYSSLVVNKHAKTDYSRAEACVRELVELLDKKTILDDEDLMILMKIKDIVEFEDKAYLYTIGVYKDYFLSIKGNTKNQPNVINTVNSILILDSQELAESLQHRTQENEQIITRLNENLAKKDLKIKILEESLKANEDIIKGLQSDLNDKINNQSRSCLIL